jgi:hypothetical protein
MRITDEFTESEIQTIEQTETVTKIRCDVCSHDYTEDEWDGREFVVDPDIDREVHSINEFEDLFDCYHRKIPTNSVEQGHDGREKDVRVPEKSFMEVLTEEAEVALERDNRTTEEQLAIESLKEDYANIIGDRNFYLIGDYIHHFMYRLTIESSTKDYKHVCSDCYDVIFD